jgi:hypothetical protein
MLPRGNRDDDVDADSASLISPSLLPQPGSSFLLSLFEDFLVNPPRLRCRSLFVATLSQHRNEQFSRGPRKVHL